MTDMGKVGWSDPKKARPMLDRIPMGRFAGKLSYITKWQILNVRILIRIIKILFLINNLF